MVVTNPTGLPQRVEQGTVLGGGGGGVLLPLSRNHMDQMDSKRTPRLHTSDHAQVGDWELQTITVLSS